MYAIVGPPVTHTQHLHKLSNKHPVKRAFILNRTRHQHLMGVVSALSPINSELDEIETINYSNVYTGRNMKNVCRIHSCANKNVDRQSIEIYLISSHQ